MRTLFRHFQGQIDFLDQINLLEKLSKANPNIVGVLSGGSPIEMPWDVNLKAILHGYLTGQAGAMALLNLLTGKSTPSGKLNETYPLKYEDTPAYSYYPAKERNSEYREAIFIGYRYYDTANVPVKYPFGYGLSYTEFEYSDLVINEKGAEFTIKNTGGYDGAEAAQLYVSLPSSGIFRAKKELKGFTKVFLKKGEQKKVSIPFDDLTFRFWNNETDSWAVEGGTYDILIGSFVEDIRLKGSLDVKQKGDVPSYDKKLFGCYFDADIKNVTDESFKALLGHDIPDGSWSGELSENDALCQMSYAKSWIARKIFKVLDGNIKKADAKGVPDLNTLFQYNMPFRAIAKMTGGMVSMEMVRDMVSFVNGHGGLFRVIRGFFKNKKANKKYEQLIRN